MIVIAPAGFKESLSAPEAADAIEMGIQQIWPDTRTCKVPVPDGGEGFTDAMVRATNGAMHCTTVTGPLGEPVEAPIGILGDSAKRTVVIEMAAAAGLSLVPRDCRNPLITSTFGVGELVSAALDLEPDRILLGCGDSGTSDGGAGMITALGVKLTDRDGDPILRGAQGLANLASIDASNIDDRLKHVTIEAACNVTNVLCGENGVARVYGPQKGANERAVQQMEVGLVRFAELAQLHVRPTASGTPHDLATMPGGGASGGLGASLVAFLGCKLRSRFDVVFDYIPLDEALADASLVITAEGSIDFQTPRGKVPAEVARRAAREGVPCIGLAGTLGDGYAKANDAGVEAVFSILDRPRSLESAIDDSAVLVANAAAQMARLINVGQHMRVGHVA